MEILYAVVGAALGIVIGFLLAKVRAGGQGSGADAELAVARARLAESDRRLADLAEAAARREADLNTAHERYVASIRADQETLRQQFQALSAETLKASQEQLLNLAQERLTRERQAADAELAKRELAVKTMVEPLAKTLAEVQRQTAEADKARAEGQAQLGEQVRHMVEASSKLDKRTSDFINTLRRSDVRGNWGEVQLRRVVELAGMLPYVDFTEQEVVRDADGKNLRPDLTVRLAGGRTIVVDSKVALSALIEAFESDDEVVRAERLAAHARHVKKHIDDLAAKKYWEQFDSAPEFVVMFVPSEAFYQAAVEQDGSLQEYAFEKRVVIATPTTLVAMLRTVAHAWKEDALAKNAAKVLATGKELVERLSTMGDHLARVGRAIDTASKAYNDTVGNLERRVLPTARRFSQLQQLEGPAEMVQLDTEIRQLTAPELDQGPSA